MDYSLPINFLIVFVSLFSVIFVMFMFAFLYRIIKHKTKETNVTDDSYNKALQIIEGARLESLKTVEKSQTAALKILNRAKGIDETTKNEFSRRLNQLNEDVVSQYKDILSSFRSKNENLLEMASEKIEKEVITGLTDFNRTMQEVSRNKSSLIEKQITEEYIKTQKEIEAYREEQLDKVRNNIIGIVSSVYAQTTDKVLNDEEYSQLIKNIFVKELDKLKFGMGD